MDRGEDCFHPGQVGLNRLAQDESVRRLKENFRNQDVTTAMLVDPFDGGVGIGCGPGSGPPESMQRLRQRVGHTGPVINDQYFH